MAPSLPHPRPGQVLQNTVGPPLVLWYGAAIIWEVP